MRGQILGEALVPALG